MENPELRLASEFPGATREAWLELVSAAIKGASFDKKLVGSTYDGLRIEPLYSRQADGRPTVGRAPAAPWQVLQRVDHPDPIAANEQARQDLEHGATGLWIAFAQSMGANGYGLDPSETVIATALEGIDLDAGLAIELDLGSQGPEVARMFQTFLQGQAVSPASIDLRFGLDPLSMIATRGFPP